MKGRRVWKEIRATDPRTGEIVRQYVRVTVLPTPTPAEAIASARRWMDRPKGVSVRRRVSLDPDSSEAPQDFAESVGA